MKKPYKPKGPRGYQARVEASIAEAGMFGDDENAARSFSGKYDVMCDRARKFNASLRADDPRFDKSAKVVHQDGSIFMINNAFIMEAEYDGTEFVLLFAEHHAPQVFAEDDLESWDQYKAERSDVEFLRTDIVAEVRMPRS